MSSEFVKWTVFFEYGPAGQETSPARDTHQRENGLGGGVEQTESGGHAFDVVVGVHPTPASDQVASGGACKSVPPPLWQLTDATAGVRNAIELTPVCCTETHAGACAGTVTSVTAPMQFNSRMVVQVAALPEQVQAEQDGGKYEIPSNTVVAFIVPPGHDGAES